VKKDSSIFLSTPMARTISPESGDDVEYQKVGRNYQKSISIAMGMKWKGPQRNTWMGLGKSPNVCLQNLPFPIANLQLLCLPANTAYFTIRKKWTEHKKKMENFQDWYIF
jgi:hypothetical protein